MVIPTYVHGWSQNWNKLRTYLCTWNSKSICDQGKMKIHKVDKIILLAIIKVLNFILLNVIITFLKLSKNRKKVSSTYSKLLWWRYLKNLYNILSLILFYNSHMSSLSCSISYISYKLFRKNEWTCCGRNVTGLSFWTPWLQLQVIWAVQTEWNKYFPKKRGNQS